MIRIFIIFMSFIVYGNFNYQVNDLVIFSLINIAFFSILKQKKIQVNDYVIFISSSFAIEIILGFPLFISASIIILPILLLSYLINNLSMHSIFHTITIFISSLFTIYLLDRSIIIRILDIQYLLLIVIIISIYLGLINYGKE